MPLVLGEQMAVVAGDSDAQTETRTRLLEPINPRPPIPPELQQELALMTPVRQMPDIAGKIVTIGTWHRPRLKCTISALKIAR